jgi:hypothetical protein
LTDEHIRNSNQGKDKSETKANVGVTDDTGTDYEEQSFMTTRLYKAAVNKSPKDELAWCEECSCFKQRLHNCKIKAAINMSSKDELAWCELCDCFKQTSHAPCNYPKGFAGQY